MGLFDKIFSKTAGNIVKSVGDAFDQNLTSEEERLAKKNEVVKYLQDSLNDLREMQADIIKAEATGNWLQRSWRPVVMLCFAFIVMYNEAISLMFSLPRTELSTDFWGLLKVGVGGYVFGRSAEKIASTTNIKEGVKNLVSKARKSN